MLRKSFEKASPILSRQSCEFAAVSSENEDEIEIILAVELRAIMRGSIGETKAKINR
jgi:hypothetical protein